MSQNSPPALFTLMRRYAWASLLVVVLTAGLIVALFRHLAIDTLVDTGTKSGITLASAAMSSFKFPLLHFLEEVRFRESPESLKVLGIPPALKQGIHGLLDDTSIVRVKIYDTEGRVVFSTKTSQIGHNQPGNPGFKSAIGGEPMAKLIYRDTFNYLDGGKEDANLIQAYIPARAGRGSPIVGVFEIYVDVNDVVATVSRNGLYMTILLAVTLLGLYGALMLIIRRSGGIIQTQIQADAEHHKTLELLTGKMLSAQEDEKKRIAEELHEEVIQTLGGVKMLMEQHLVAPALAGSGSGAVDQGEVIPVLQETIRRMRMVAMDLRPSALDEFGLEATLDSMVSECNHNNCCGRCQIQFNLSEEQLSKERKDILFRIVKDVISRACRMDAKGTVEVVLGLERSRITLAIGLRGEAWRWQENAGEETFMREKGFQSLREHTLLSGGMFSAKRSPSGHIDYRASWE